MKLFNRCFRLSASGGWLLLVSLSCPLASQAAQYQSHQLQKNQLQVQTDEYQLQLSFKSPGAVEVFYQQSGVKQLPSFALAEPELALPAQLKDEQTALQFGTEQLQVRLQKSPLQLQFYRGNELILKEEAGYFAHQTLRGFRFALTPDEKLLGGGERVLGMDRRGQRLPLYNKASYGYNGETKQMYFGLPAVLSSKKYALVFDNSASGFLDLGATEKDVLQFEAVAGRTSYLVVTAPTYPQLMQQYVNTTGKQPLPPRWAFGNFASRFGYRTEQQSRDIVQKFHDADFPLDALVLDLYWFGKDIQGHMGNLAWDNEAFPQPKQMIADFKAKGVNTILITEPFVLSSSKRWDEAVAANALAKNLAGQPKRFDFYFGNTGLVDVFSTDGQAWFNGIYNQLAQDGVAGWWGDLGEPEVHPADSIHAIGSADEIHNAYGHQWAAMLYQNRLAQQPKQRPMIMMRAGFAGSQRYGMIPWTGDVDRSWGGLKPQVELALQMGLLGMGYTHSDLGGFAGGEQFDQELYVRWLQYGVFQPVFRPHAQEHIAPEPVLHDQATQDLLRPFVKLRYRMAAYNYTLAYQNSTLGLPLMRPLFFADENQSALMLNKDSYFWGDAFLVTPVTAPGVKSVPVQLPKGVWLDYFSGQRYEGGRTIEQPTSLSTLPVLVKAGAFVPLVPAVQSLSQYSSRQLELHYYHDDSVAAGQGELYEDDGVSPDSLATGQYELLKFNAVHAKGQLQLSLDRTGLGYTGMPKQRAVTLVLHQLSKASAIELDGQPLPELSSQAELKAAATGFYRDKSNNQLWLKLDWTKARHQLQLSSGG